MIVAEISKYQESEAQTNYAPFVFQQQPATHTTADYWINAFGAADESIINNIHVNDFIRDYYNNYSETNNLQDCLDTIQSLFWDHPNYILFVHYELAYSPFTDNYYEFGRAFGFCTDQSIYIDDVYYEGNLTSIPSVAQQQDLVNYERLAFMTGSLELLNNEGMLDEFIADDITGTKIRTYYLDYISGVSNYTRSQLESQAAYFIEDYSLSLTRVVIDLQDLRAKQNLEIPTELFTLTEYPNIKDKYIDDVIPLIYGQVRRSEAIPVDGELGTGNDITFRQALLLTTLGTVQVEIDDQWTTKVPTSSDLASGTFVIAEADGRKANGEPYKCRVVDSIGIINTYSSDIIKDLNERYINVDYNNSLYNTTEWEAEETSLEPIGIVFNEQIELYEAIAEVQRGSNTGFRYEIAGDGRRTIRIDNLDRDSVFYIPNIEIDNIFDSPVRTNKQLLSATVNVGYYKDYEGDKYLHVENDDYMDTVLQNYREQPPVNFDTHLVTEAQAEDRAELYASRFSEMPKILETTLKGIEYFAVRIYDIIEVEITNGTVNADTGEITGREFFGIWKVQVLSIDPDYSQQSNSITAYLVEKIEPATRAIEASATKIIVFGANKKWRIL